MYSVRLLLLGLSLLISVYTNGQTQTEHFTFVADERSAKYVETIARIAEGKRQYLLSYLGIEDQRKITVYLVSDPEAMQMVVGRDRVINEWVAGMAFDDENKIIVSLKGDSFFKGTDIFVHEIAHIYLHSALGGRKAPRWFHEGFSMLAASEELGENLKRVLIAASTDNLIPIQTLEDGFPKEAQTVFLAYAQALLFVRFLDRFNGGIRHIIQRMRGGLSFEDAVKSVTGQSISELWEKFKQSYKKNSSLWLVIHENGIIWIALSIVFLLVFLIKRRRAKLKKKKMEIEEALEHFER